MARRDSRSWVLLATLAVVLPGWVGSTQPQAAPSSPAAEAQGSVGKHVSALPLRDLKGESVTIAGPDDRDVIVIVFVGTECPINNSYAQRLSDLAGRYAKTPSPRVRVVAVNANRQDAPGRIAEHAKSYGLTIPVLKDAGNAVADRLGARRTPEAFVLDKDRVIRYQGRIDDQFGYGYKRANPGRDDLAAAIDEVLAGKPVSVPFTQVSGCLISRVRPTGGGSAAGLPGVTYCREVARILQAHCQECHRPGQIGPMSLMTYEDAASWSDTIAEVLRDGRMPPWYADPKHGKFSNDRRLPDEDRQALLDWVAAGTPRGEEKHVPPARLFPEGWRIGTPDLILSMPKPFDVPAEVPANAGGIEYQHFRIDPGFTEDRWVQRAEARPGAAAVVHHVVVFIVPPGRHFNPNDPNSLVLCGTAPGDMPLILPPGTAKRIPAGASLVLQVHYTPNGKAQPDRSSVGLIFAPSPPPSQVETYPVHNPVFCIPPGAADYKVDAWFRFETDARLIELMPHMHLRGKDFKYELVYPNGRKEVILSVPRYQFYWQSIYRFAEPLAVPKGTRIHCVAHYDNSKNNPNNPDPTRPVFWGDQTWEEMMIGWVSYAVPRKEATK